MTNAQPLADRIRPQTLADFVGQAHLVGEGMPLRIAVERGNLRSMIFWGPPGVGKTTLARILARSTNRAYHELSAVSAGKKDLAGIVNRAQQPTQPRQRDMFSMGADDNDQLPTQKGVLLFLDEIHRFNKAQQDFLLPYVEDGTLLLIGATTENPSFEVISALLSRSQVYVLHPLKVEELQTIIRQGVAALGTELEHDALDFLASYANGDARKALNVLQNAAELYAAPLSLHKLRDVLQSKQLRYDKTADEHYDTISAYIKSMRASNPDAALYYMARMLEGGEDPKYIARRMVVFASEDVGIADPHALTLANAVFRAVEIIGLPEAAINLAHGTVYMATAPKDRTAYRGLRAAQSTVQESGNLPIPLGLRNAPTQLMKDMGYAGELGSAPDDLLPNALKGKRFYEPDD